MSRHVDAFARQHIEALGRLFGLFLAVFMMAAVLQAGISASNSEAGAKWEAGQISFDLAIREKRRRLDEVLERLRMGQPQLR